jgi:hypothetical protein
LQLDDWLAHPAVQAGVIPFAVSLVVAAALARTRLAAWAQVAGVLACATLAVGWSFEALTSTRKLVLIVASTALLAAWIESSQVRARAVGAACVALIAFAGVWMLWRPIAQRDAGAIVATSALVIVFVGALVGATLWVSDDPVQGTASGVALGAGSGAVAVLGASAVLGMLGIAAAASCGATLIACLVLRGTRTGRSIALPAAVTSALVGIAAVVTGELRAVCLVPLLLVPLAVRFVVSRLHAGAWLRAVAASLVALIPVAGAVGLAWFHTP